ncbi:MAG: biotin/lipoyl-binding protein, partial [Chloroflexi bacterium]|nr:biotin/lipoyl-binding protein [Chloroflexota bacterium]
MRIVEFSHDQLEKETAMKFYKKRSNLVYAGIALAAITGIAWMIGASSKAGETAVPELQTARVRTGDLVITASGAGTVIPAAQVDLGFRTSGVVTEVDMILGQQVASGDILARLDDRSEQIAFTQAEANLNALFSSSGIAEYQIELANAQSAYSTALGTLQYYISPDVYYWETRLLEAQRALAVVESEANASQAAILDAQDVVEWAGYNLQVTQAAYLNIYLPETFGAIVIDEVTLEEVIVVTPPNPIDVALARATLEQARLAVADAQAALEIIQAGDRAA